MSAVDDIIEENMVCATVNAPHHAMSTTIEAYLVAHRPDKALAFRISTPSTDMADWCQQVLGDEGVTALRSGDTSFVGTAAGRIWTKLLSNQGELLDRHSISLSPVRPGQS